MASVLEEIFSAAIAYIGPKLPAVKTELGYKDDRATVNDDTQYPLVEITLYDMIIDDKRKNGGWISSQTASSSTTVTMKKLPIPVTYFFQIDTFAKKRREDWELQEAITKILGNTSASIVTFSGKKLYFNKESFTALDDISDDDVFRKVYRFYMEAWITHPDVAVVEFKVLSRVFIINKERWIMD